MQHVWQPRLASMGHGGDGATKSRPEALPPITLSSEQDMTNVRRGPSGAGRSPWIFKAGKSGRGSKSLSEPLVS